MSNTNNSRRSFLKHATALTAVGALAPHTLLAKDIITEPLSKVKRDAMTPEAIIQAAKEGNIRFTTGNMLKRDYLSKVAISGEGQHPAAVLLTCIDSRTPAEIFFDLGVGDTFNCRIAGNIVNPDILGSMEFATKLAGAKVIMVIGHTRCGAVKGAIADAKLGNLTQLLEKFHPAIAATVFDGDKSADNYAYVDAVARKNVELALLQIRKESPVIAALEKENQVKLAGAFYDVGTGKVEFFA